MGSVAEAGTTGPAGLEDAAGSLDHRLLNEKPDACCVTGVDRSTAGKGVSGC